MKLWARLGFLALILAPVAAFGDNSPTVILAQPGIGNGAIERFTARFSQPMVGLGDPRAASPFATECAVSGEGRWVDQQTYVYEFANALPGGTTCKFTLAEGLKSLAGYAVGGTRVFTVDAGGPVARAVLPGQYEGDIEEDQVFLVAANLAPTPGSVAANAYCAVDGLGEKIAVDVLPGDTAAKLLPQLKDNYPARSFLESAGLPQDLPASTADRMKALGNVVALKCRRPLPPGRDMALVWSGQIASAGGKLAGTDQKFDFSVRKPFTARFECGRVNPQAGCNPVESAYVRFTAPIALAQAKAIRIRTADGKELSPDLKSFEKNATTTGDVTFKGLPYATAGTVVLPAGIKDESGRVLANAERFPLAVRFDQAPPLIKFAASFGIVEANAGAMLPVTIRNVEPALQGRNLAVAGKRVKVADNDAAIAAWLRKVDDADDYDVETVKRNGEDVNINNTGSKPVLGAGEGAPLSIALPGKGKDFEVVGVPLKEPGFYVVEFASPALGRSLLGRDAPRYVASAALVTNLAVHFKWGAERSLAWVTSLDTGKPVVGAAVQVSDSCTGKLLARGTTGKGGGLYVPNGLPRPETYGSCDSEDGSHPLMVSARANGDFGFALTQWGEGIRPYDFDLPYGYSAREDIFHTIFDRALVRQGETIHMKHIVRREAGAGFALAPGFTGTLRLTHSGSDTQFDLPLKIDANGIGETEWTAPQGAPMGDYNIQVVRGDDTLYTSQSFKVDEYRLPTMKASVAGPKAPVIKGTSLPLDLFVGYLSGGGAANLPVDLRVNYAWSETAPANYEGYTFGGRPLKEGTRPLNGDGAEDTPTLPPAQTLPATLGGDGAARNSIELPTLDQNAVAMVEMDYEDANGETLTSSRSIPLWTSAVRLGVKTDGWLMKQDDLRLRFVATDVTGKPIEGRKIVVDLYSKETLTARRRLIGGFYAYDNQAKTTKLAATCTATTDDKGLAQCALDPDVSGEVYAVASTTDADGNVARAVTSVWLAGDEDWWFGGDNGDRMDVVAEQPEYKSGDTAKFQVRMPFRSATALVTVEREGVLSSYTTTLSGKDPVIEVKLDGAYAPDVFVSVLAVRGRAEAGWWSWLEELGRKLGLVSGPPAAPEPTALVDLAKPSYRLGIAKIKVGWDAHRLGVSVTADRERYAARDVAQVDVTVKTPDGKPARSADVAFAAVDQALLQLAPNDSWDVLTAVMGERPLSVLTATAQTQVVGKRHYGKKAVEAGGGGGGDLSGLNRENFQPVLLWRGRVALDANGHARVPVQLNDALSAFKLVAIATDGAQLYGTGMAEVRTAQDLTIFAGLPPLVRTGDYYAASFTLRNGSAKPMTVTANVDVFPKIAAGKPLTVTIPAGGAAPVAWNLTAPGMAGNLRWQVRAKAADGKAADMVTVTQEVVPAVPTEVWAATLARVGPESGGGSSIMIQPPAGALLGFGTVEVRLADTLAPPLEGVRRYMAAYPYNCFEQRLSKAVALGDMSAFAALAGDMPTYQAPDGLLRYFPSDSMTGSEALSAYVLALTSEAGLQLPAAPRAKLIEALKAVLDGRLRNEQYGDVRLQKAMIFAALARAGAATPAMLGQIGMTPQEMPTGTLADYLAALDRVPGLANAADLKAQAESTLRSRFVYEGTRVDLTDAANAPWWLMGSGDESAIKALVATIGRPGWQDETPKLMVGVSLRQSRGHWDTTTANAWGTVAARKFANAYPADAVTGTTTLALSTRTISKAWPLALEQRLASFALPAQPSPLRLAQSGGAGPWAMVQVSAAVPLSKALFAGYRLTRKVDVVQARKPGVLTRGDVVRVTLTVEASAERNWVVIADPVPGGATIVGGLGGQSAALAEGGASEGTQPSYVERGKDAWRGYFQWLPRGTATVSYTLRLNGAGRFNLPPSRVEAMYSPAIRAAVPNQPVTVVQR